MKPLEGGTGIYRLYLRSVLLCCEGYGFQAAYSGIGYNYKSASLGLEHGIIFLETDQLVEDFSLDQGNREYK